MGAAIGVTATKRYPSRPGDNARGLSCPNICDVSTNRGRSYGRLSPNLPTEFPAPLLPDMGIPGSTLRGKRRRPHPTRMGTRDSTGTEGHHRGLSCLVPLATIILKK